MHSYTLTAGSRVLWGVVCRIFGHGWYSIFDREKYDGWRCGHCDAVVIRWKI